MTARLTPLELRQHALAIWQAGVDAVRSESLVANAVHVSGGQLRIGDLSWSLADIGKIVVVGCGKAGAGMADGLERALGARVLHDKDVTGWVNVPSGCERPLQRIHLHPARPAGVNEPTDAGVQGAEKILNLVSNLGENDVCICLISGGGSALLPAPAHGITLADKLAVTKHLSGAGANIRQMNTVRKQLSRIKGGGLARACKAGKLISLIISDVLGDPLDVIASGPTVADTSTPADALQVLEQFDAREAGISPAVFDVLERKMHSAKTDTFGNACQPTNLVIGNNAAAVSACADEARQRGFLTSAEAITELEGDAESIGRQLADKAVELRGMGQSRNCFVSGGEPVVQLVSAERRGRGGRNQQLVLAGLRHLLDRQAEESLAGVCLVSGGTDGEDGPTDAAGALADALVVAEMRKRELDPERFLRDNDAYNFFTPLGGLIMTGPTNTNVCDVRVVVTG